MSNEFDLDISAFKKALEKMPESIGDGSKRALERIKDDWVQQSQAVAPVDTGNLRDLITGEVKNPGANGYVVVSGNAHAMKGGDHFNYGHYIHENDAGGKSLRSPSAEKQYLDVPAEQNEEKWQGWLEDEMKKALGEWSK